MSTFTHNDHVSSEYGDPEDIVITGFSGKFPESENMIELWENIMNKTDLLTENIRWPKDIYGLPPKMGLLKDLSKFDATFFGVHAKQTEIMDPQLRILLECAHEAIVDSGYDPAEFSGSNTAVYVGTSHSETKDNYFASCDTVDGYGLLGCAFSMFANRLSFVYNLQGPSFAIDAACSSTLCAMNQAVLAMRTKQCDAALVCGTNVCLNPITSYQFFKMKMLDPAGFIKPFDIAANGYCRSETIGVIVLQRRKHARRIYAELTHIKINTDGAKAEGITYPSYKMQTELMQSLYEEAQVDPNDVHFVEAHGTGTRVGDPAEGRALATVFCKRRTEPLLIGSIKSNLGHAEPGSGVSAIGKLLLCIKERMIPPNINFSVPNPEIEPLIKGELKVVTEPTPLEGEYVALNNFGFGGVNCHLLMKAPPEVTSSKVEEPLPRLVLWCDRTERGVNSMLDYLENTEVPEETYGFIQNLYKRASMSYRGYTLLRKDRKSCFKQVKSQSMAKRPVWYVFSGMGTQWSGMGLDLLQLEPFAKSLYHSVELLKPYGIDLMKVLSTVGDKKETSTREIVPAFVSIAAIQVALVDTLKELGITPDGIVGHSVGELGCAYADGCLTAEQMVLSAYWRGKCVEDAGLISGAMAAVGLSWEETKKKCPSGVLPACNNSEDTVTISGPVNDIKSFVKQLNAENIFVREVDSCGYAFHCSYVNPAAPSLSRALEKLIPNPKPRSDRWVSSSIPESNWDIPVAKHCSASYLVNNLVSSVLFREALLYVPSDAVVIEIGPHCLLQAILRRSLSDKCSFISLMNRKEPNNLEYLLSSVGNMYNSGLDPEIEKLYSKITYPVPKSVPMISPLITWDHTQSWNVATWSDARNMAKSSEVVIEIDITSPESKDYFMVGHCIDGRLLFPAAGYLLLAWKALAKLKSKVFHQMPVEFEDFYIHKATILSKTTVTRFHVSLLQVSGEFEVSEGGNVAANGKIREIEEVVVDLDNFPRADPSDFMLDRNDIYKELRLLGYEYGPSFQSLIDANSQGTHGSIEWTDQWESFLDGLLQISVFTKPVKALFLPTRIRSIQIDPRVITNFSNGERIRLFCDKRTNECVSAGIHLKGLKATVAPRRQDLRTVPLLEEYQFIPYNESLVLKETHQVQEYANVCYSLARRIFKTRAKGSYDDFFNDFKEPSETIVENYISESKDNFVILNSLKELSELPSNESYQENSKPIIDRLRLNIRNDLISRTLLSERALRTTLDVVIENTPLSKLKILEICTSGTIDKEIQRFMLDCNIGLNTSYTIACPEPEIFDESVNAINWDLNSSPPTQLSSFDLVVVKDVDADFKELIKNISPLIKDNGFLLLIHRYKLTPLEKYLSSFIDLNLATIPQEEIESLTKAMGLSSICEKNDGVASSLHLLRKTVDRQSAHREVVHVLDKDFRWVEQLKIAMNETSEKSNVWLVAQDSSCNGVIGLVNCLRREEKGNRIRCFFDARKGENQIPPFDLNDSVFKALVQKDLVMNVYRDRKWGSFRHTTINEDKSIMTDHALVNIQIRGDLSTLHWVASPTIHTPIEELHYIYYSALNFKDIMLATGKLPPDAIAEHLAADEFILGMEYSGRNKSGKRVMGLLQTGRALATVSKVESKYFWNVPDRWTLEEACTIPVAYSTAYYALVIRGRLKKGESVLIHSGSGGVGQAAITIALSMNCKVFTTVGTVEKRNFLKKRFPRLTDDAIFNSRDISFEKYLLWATNGEGVKVVLNSLSDEKLQASLRCVGKHGRFLEIGKYDSAMNNSIGMAILLKNISIYGIHLDQSLIEEEGDILVKLVNDGINSGVVQPLDTIMYERREIEDAFRFMASGRHIGKVIIKIREEEKELRIPPPKFDVPAKSRAECNPEKVYIVCGGLGGFGVEFTSWLVSRGARHLVLTSRSGIRSGYQRLQLQNWKIKGVDVVVSSLDASDYSQAVRLIQETRKCRDIGGIFNLAVVLRDGFLENLTEEDYRKVVEPKATATYNLDKISRQYCFSLDWFVVFSSVSCGRGNAGQSNYGYANSVMERICEERKRDGFPGLAIQWGAIGDVGLVFENMGGNDVEVGGTLPQRLSSCFSTLDKLLYQDAPVVSSLVLAKRSFKKAGSNEKDLLDIIANIFGIKDKTTLNPSITLGELGMDSLMGVEVKQTLERDYDLFLSMQEIRMLSVTELIEIGEQSQLDPAQQLLVKKDSEMANAEKNITVKEHLTPKQCIVKMNKSEKGNPLFIFPSIEGTIDNLTSIVTDLPHPVYGLQCTSEVPLSSIRDMALYYCELIESKHQSGDPYHLLGYSNFGSIVAVEVAIELQRRGNAVRRLFFLNEVPLETATIKSYGGSILTEEEKMLSFIQQFIEVSHKDMLIQHLANLSSTKAKLEYIASMLAISTHVEDKGDIISAAQLYLKRMSCLDKYQSNETFKGNVVLLMPSENISDDSSLERNFEKSELCEGDVTVHRIEMENGSILKGKSGQQLTSIITKETQLG